MKNNNKSYQGFVVSKDQLKNRKKLFKLFKNSPIPDEELPENIGLFTIPTQLKKYLLLNDLYKQILNVPGIIVEFGIRWGQNLNLFQDLRSIYEPFNHNRKIVGFDTFEGFPKIHEKDGKNDNISVGDFSVSEHYEKYLDMILSIQEKESPLSHFKKFEIRKGNAISEIKRYLKEYTETIISLAYFDLDLYEPTKECLKTIKDRLTKGSILVFDEFNFHRFPGETLAVKEVLGINNFFFKRSPYSFHQSYIIF